MEKTYFTLPEANALIGYLTDTLTMIHKIKSDIVGLIEYCEKKGILFDEIFSKENLSEDEVKYRNKLEEMGDEINDLIFEIEEKGAVVKDIEQGLVDFYAKINGEDVFLCWKMGESEISFWHHVHEGFEGRQNLLERSILESVTRVH